MDHEELKKLYGEVEQKLGERFWLVPRDRAMLFIGALCTFCLITLGGSWLAAYKAVSSSPAKDVTREIEKLRDHAQVNTDLIAEQAKVWQQGDYLRHISGLANGLEAIFNFEPHGSSRPSDDKLIGARYKGVVVPAYEFFKAEREKAEKK